MKYAYACADHGIIEVDVPADSFVCMEDGCGATAKRVRSFSVNASSLKSQDRWDPVVGAYVRNENEFRSLLAAQAEREERDMGVECKLVTVDARDSEGLAELHGVSPDVRAEDLEPTKKAEWEKARA